MWKLGFFLLSGLLVTACSPGLAPNGMTWEEYHAAEFRLKVKYFAEDVVGCVELGAVRGASWDDVGEAKEEAIAQALMFNADTLLLDNLWSDWRPFRLVGRKEIFYAEGQAYRCKK